MDWVEAVIHAAADETAFMRMTLSEPARTAEWQRAVLRPVALKHGTRIQMTMTGGGKVVTRNCERVKLPGVLQELLRGGFARIHVQSSAGDLHVRITRKGRVLISRGAPSRQGNPTPAAHDRAKSQPLPLEGPDPFLAAIGVKNERGEVRPSMQAKFRQINGFIRLVEAVLPKGAGPISLLDCGCGSAHLTFAIYHHVHHILKREARVLGIDRNPEIIAKCRQLCDRLGWDRLDFKVAEIGGFEPPFSPDLTLALHACDLATDEALARGVQWNSHALVAAPCCQHELHHILQSPIFMPVLRHGILRERMADLLTDAFRALALRAKGYRAEVVEFVAPEYTPKNLVIRAVRGRGAGDPIALRELKALKAFWGVAPRIESLLGLNAMI